MSYKYPCVWKLSKTVNQYCDRGYHRGVYKCTNKGCGGWTYGDPVPDNEEVTPPKGGMCPVARKPRKKTRTKTRTNPKTSPIISKKSKGGKSRRRSKKKPKKKPTDCAPGDLRCPMCAYHYPNKKTCPHC